MSKTQLRFRQVHLDFHTSEAIGGVGEQFAPDEFADTIDRARVDSITVFARCHHGWLYYPSKHLPHRVHPNLRRPTLLAEQIDALHARDIRAPIYITVQWDQASAEDHPEWLCRDSRGTPITEVQEDQSFHDAFAPGFYRFLCVNTGYREYLKFVTREVIEMHPTDGVFYDIVKPVACACTTCRAKMREQGLDPSDRQARIEYGYRVITEFMHEMSDLVRSLAPDATIFYNSSHISPAHRPWLDAFSHLELESLPSGGWGYAHFPLTMRYARTLGLDCMGMTGKFHTSWGDFQSFKNPAALEFECFHALALGGTCSIGDQLPPSGKICPHTYDLIGSVYRQVERKEPWCAGAEPVVDIGVLCTTDFARGTHKDLSPALLGATRMLSEAAQQFDIIDEAADLASYRLLILPDDVKLSPAHARKIRDWLGQGGALIASCAGGLEEQGERFALPELGVTLRGEAEFSPDFLLPLDGMSSGLAQTEHVMYLRGMDVQHADDAEVLAEVIKPYFNRTWEHFCSHRHTPSSGEKAGYPGVVQAGSCIYFAHPIFSQYAENAPLWCRKLLVNALDRLLPQPAVRTNAPSTAIVTVTRQPAESRLVVHVLHYIPERRGRAFDVVEDVIPLRDVEISLRADAGGDSARLVPDGQPLEVRPEGDRIVVTVPEIQGHAMIELT